MATWWKWPVLVLALFLAPIRALEVVEESEEPTEYEHINSIPYELVKKAPTERGKYSKSVLAEGYPFAEISGLDFSDSKDIAAAVKNLRQVCATPHFINLAESTNVFSPVAVNALFLNTDPS